MKKEIIMSVNEIYSFTLESHIGGGYLWTIVSNDEKITNIELTSQTSTKAIDSIPIGKSFPTQVDIKAIAKGKSVIILEEKREWEERKKPLNSFKLTITVK